MDKLELTQKQISDIVKNNPKIKELMQRNLLLLIFIIPFGIISAIIQDWAIDFLFLLSSIIVLVIIIRRNKSVVRSILPRRQNFIIKK